MVDSNAASGSRMDAQSREQIPDMVLMYACIFTYEKSKIRNEILNYQFDFNAIAHYESRYHSTFRALLSLIDNLCLCRVYF